MTKEGKIIELVEVLKTRIDIIEEAKDYLVVEKDNYFADTSDENRDKLILYLVNEIERLEKRIEDGLSLQAEVQTRLEEQIKELQQCTQEEIKEPAYSGYITHDGKFIAGAYGDQKHAGLYRDEKPREEMSEKDQLEKKLNEIERRIDRIIKYISKDKSYEIKLRLKYGIKHPEYNGSYLDDQNKDINLEKRQEHDKKTEEYFVKVIECEKEFEDI